VLTRDAGMIGDAEIAQLVDKRRRALGAAAEADHD
jgi:hypothetical protein